MDEIITQESCILVHQGKEMSDKPMFQQHLLGVKD